MNKIKLLEYVAIPTLVLGGLASIIALVIVANNKKTLTAIQNYERQNNYLFLKEYSIKNAERLTGNNSYILFVKPIKDIEGRNLYLVALNDVTQIIDLNTGLSLAFSCNALPDNAKNMNLIYGGQLGILVKTNDPNCFYSLDGKTKSLMICF